MTRHWWKEIFKRMVRKRGYEITRRGERNRYTLSSAFGYFTYSPWFEDQFQSLFAPLRPIVCSQDDRCYMIYEFARHCAHLEGDYAEAGVYRGGTAVLMATALQRAGRTDKLIHLFDTFCGMPEIANADKSIHGKGDLNQTSLAEVQSRLAQWNFVRFYPGIIPDSLAPVSDRRFALVHVDVDLYASTRDAYRFFYERMVPGGVMLCDDYGFPAYEHSAMLAVNEFFADKPERPIVLPTGQALVIKL